MLLRLIFTHTYCGGLRVSTDSLAALTWGAHGERGDVKNGLKGCLGRVKERKGVGWVGWKFDPFYCEVVCTLIGPS